MTIAQAVESFPRERQGVRRGVPPRRFRLAPLLVAPVGLLALALAAPAAASAHASSLGTARGDGMQWRLGVSPVKGLLDDVGAKDPGFTSVEADESIRKIVVYRKTGMSRPEYVHVGARNGASIVFRASIMSASETQGVMEQVWSSRAQLRRHGIVVDSLESHANGTVDVGILNADASARAVVQRMFGRAHATGAIKIVAPLKVTPASGRWNDTSPFIGGDRIESATGTFTNGHTGYKSCTSGFGGLSSNGQHYLVTAYHCMNPKDARFWTGDLSNSTGGNFIGTASAADKQYDLAYIPTGTGPRVWDGPVAPLSSQFTKNVVSTYPTKVGDNICTSGSYSGVICYGTVTGQAVWTYTSDWVGGDTYSVAGWLASKTDGAQMMATGDSGGPVFTPSGNSVIAKGIISGGANPVACTQGYTSNSTCYSKVFFPDFFNAVAIGRSINPTL